MYKNALTGERLFSILYIEHLFTKFVCMTENLYKKRKEEVLRFYKRHHRLPSYEELTQVFSVKSKNSVHSYIQKFIDDGLVAKSETGKLIPTKRLYGLRVLGTIQAGFPTSSEEEAMAEVISLDEMLVRNPDTAYVLTVEGDSMIDAGIMKGDMVIVDRSKHPKSGDVVVAEIDQGWTLKFFIQKGANAFLRPANRKYKDIYPQDELRVGGVVTSVIRKYA